MLTYTAIPLGPLQTNCYIVYDEAHAIVIDPGWEPSPVLDFVKKKNVTVQGIYNTHLHFDHTSGDGPLAKACGVIIRASERDGYLQHEAPESAFGFPAPPPYDIVNLDAGEETVLGVSMRVLATPGHTPGGLSFYFAELGAVFCGDTLFRHSVGRTDFPGGDHSMLELSIRNELYSLPDETRVCCGHGPESTIGAEKTGNPFVRA